MYRKPRFLEELHAIREEMSRDCDYDIDLFAEMVRSGVRPEYRPARHLRNYRAYDSQIETNLSGQNDD